MDEITGLIEGVGLLLIIIVPLCFIFVYYDEETKRKQNQKMEATDKENTFSVCCEKENRFAIPEEQKANKLRYCSKKRYLKIRIKRKRVRKNLKKQNQPKMYSKNREEQI